MIQPIWKRLAHGPAVVAGLTLVLAAAAGRPASADDGPGGGRLVGAWTIQVTLRNCETGAPMGSFAALVSFHRGGTLSESPGGLAFQPGQRSDGHGEWTHLGGRYFSQRMIGLIKFASPANLPGTPTFDPTKPVSPGFSAGWQTITHRIGLTGPNSFESTGTNEFFESNGQSYRTGCSTAVAQRFQ